jgi:ribosome assembly protein RRB1
VLCWRAQQWSDKAVGFVVQEEVALGLAENALAPADLPAQLLFIHAGQTDVKEAHWHAQIPGMLASTAADGLHVFKPYNILDSS